MPGRLTFVLGFECDRNLVLAKALSAIRNNHKREFEVVIMIAVVTGVGSEVAHRVTPGAGHRPPLKPCMQIFRTRLSRRFILPR